LEVLLGGKAPTSPKSKRKMRIKIRKRTKRRIKSKSKIGAAVQS
jgi:hypothetical protein